MRIVVGFFVYLFTIIFSALLFVELIAAVYVASLTSTVANPQFIKQELERADIYALAKQELDANLEDFVPGLGQTQMYQVIQDSITEEWLADQVEEALDSVSDYLDRKIDTIEISFSTDGFKQGMKTALHDSVHTSPPAGLQGLTPQQLDEYLEPAYAGIDQLLPAQITVAVNNVDKLDPLRDLFKAVHTVPSILFMLAGVFTLILVFLHFSVKGAFRFVGIPLFITGVVIYVVNWVGLNIGSRQIATMNLPSPLTPDLVLQIVRDVLAPANTYAIIIGAVGLVLFIASFFVNRLLPKKA